MANDYYSGSGAPSTGSAGSSATIRAEFSSIKAGFDKMADLTGNGGLPVFVNSGATGQEAISASSARTKLGVSSATDTQNQSANWCGTATGTVNVITATATPAITAYAAGQVFRFVSSGANTTNVTINVNSLGAKAITKNGTTALAAGDIPSGAVVEIIYDGTRFQFIGVVADRMPISSLNSEGFFQTATVGNNTTRPSTTAFVQTQIAATLAAKAITNQIMIVRDEKASGTDGGASVAATTVTRTLNTVAANTITGASLASSQITLPAGTYRVRASAPCCVNNQLRLYNTTTAANQIIGTTENAFADTAVDPCNVRSFVVGRFTIASTNVFELRHYTASVRAINGLGVQLASGVNEVYSEIEIIKEA